MSQIKEILVLFSLDCTLLQVKCLEHTRFLQVKLVLNGYLGHSMVWKLNTKESQKLEGRLERMSYPLDQWPDLLALVAIRFR